MGDYEYPGARGENFRRLQYMNVLHNYYITYICLFNHQIHIINVLTGSGSHMTFLLITSLIFNGFSIRKKFWKAETQGYSMVI